MSFCGESSGGIVECLQIFQATKETGILFFFLFFGLNFNILRYMVIPASGEDNLVF